VVAPLIPRRFEFKKTRGKEKKKKIEEVGKTKT